MRDTGLAILRARLV